jgi:hypothetical protein
MLALFIEIHQVFTKRYKVGYLHQVKDAGRRAYRLNELLYPSAHNATACSVYDALPILHINHFLFEEVLILKCI